MKTTHAKKTAHHTIIKNEGTGKVSKLIFRDRMYIYISGLVPSIALDLLSISASVFKN